MSEHETKRSELDELDPGRWDPGYWERFQQTVMRRAAPELLRRRSRLPLTINEVVQSWARLLVPTMAAAAALATVLLALDGTPSGSAGDADLEAFAGDVEGGRLPAVIAADSAGSSVFASQEF